jgi:hypothetical protein
MTADQPHPQDATSKTVLEIMKRIGNQHDLKEAWEHMPNAERNYIAGDLYNIIASHSQQEQSHTKQCETCIFWGKRECIEHGYPESCIPLSCEYKIGKFAVIAPIEAQMHNKEHDAAIRKKERERVQPFRDEELVHILHSLETRPGTCWLCESITRKIESLRAGDGK